MRRLGEILDEVVPEVTAKKPGPPRGCKVPVYTAAMVRKAQEYYRAGMSVAEVQDAVALRFQLSQRPSDFWVRRNVQTRSASKGRQYKELGSRRDELCREVLTLVRDGLSLTEIGRRTGLTLDMVRSLAGDMAPKSQRGKRVPAAKKRRAQEMREGGATWKEIGAHFGRTRQAVQQWVQSLEAAS